MKIAAQHPAPRSDSKLDTHLDPEQADAFAHRLDCGMSLTEAADYILEEHGLKLSRPSISRWAQRRRRGKSETTFARLAEAVKAAPAAKEEETLDGAVMVNALMLNQLIHAAGMGGDPYGMMHASKVFANLLGASARAKRADTSRMAAETARWKFEFNAAKAALAHADALHKISKECQEDEDAKMVRAIARMFGRRPKPSTTPLTEWEQRIEDAAIEIEAEERAKEEAAAAAAGGEGESAAPVPEGNDPARESGDSAPECQARAAQPAADAPSDPPADARPPADPGEAAAPASHEPPSPPFDPELAEYLKQEAARAERRAERLRRRPMIQAPPKPDEEDETAFLTNGPKKWFRPKFR